MVAITAGHTAAAPLDHENKARRPDVDVVSIEPAARRSSDDDGGGRSSIALPVVRSLEGRVPLGINRPSYN